MTDPDRTRPDPFSVSASHLRSTVSTKWHKHGPDVIGAWIADMDFAVAPPIAEVMQRYVADGFFGYGRATLRDEMVEAFATWWAVFGLRVEPDQVQLVSELVQAMHACVAAFSRPGDGVLVFTPVYPPFFAAVQDQGRRIVEYRLTRDQDPAQFGFDPEVVRELVERERPRVMLLCHPHNPLGRAWTAAELTFIGDLAHEFNLVVVSDEIHADLVFDGRSFRSFATLSDDAAERTVTLASASKSFNTAGLRCALMHFGSHHLYTQFKQALPGDLLGVPSVPGMLTSIAAWRHGGPWLDECRTLLQGNRDLVAQRLLSVDTGIAGTVNEATYLQWLDLAALPGVVRALAAQPTACAADLIRQDALVACNPGPDFGADLRTCARLNFATSSDLLDDICTRIIRFAEVNRA